MSFNFVDWGEDMKNSEPNFLLSSVKNNKSGTGLDTATLSLTTNILSLDNGNLHITSKPISEH